MKKTILSYLIGFSLLCLGGQLLLGCETWDLPTRKKKGTCEKPSGTLTAIAQERKVNFSITNSSGSIDRVSWDFGNGSTTITTGMTVTHTYSAPGTYTVKATLTNPCDPVTILMLSVSAADAVAPTVSLQPATGVSTNSATVGMTVTSTGNAPITRYGICYSSKNMMPEIGKSDVLMTDKPGPVAPNIPVSFVLTNLEPNTTYYVRSFATNSSGKTGHSPDPVQIVQTGSTPSVSIVGTPNVGITTATVNFAVANAGNPVAIEYGICYSLTNEITITNSTVVPVAPPSVGVNTPVNLTNLQPNTTYYYRSYAKLPSGEVIYSPATESFKTQIDTLAQDLIASVSFTDGSLLDVSGNNNHAIRVNNPTFTADRKGKANSAISLNGSGDYFYMAENSTLNPDALTVSIWIKPNVVDRRMQIYNKSRFNDGSAEMYSSLIKPNENGAGVTINTDIKQNSNCQGGIGWQTFTFSSDIQLNTWHHVVMTYSGQSARMYFDNALLSSPNNLPANAIDKCTGGELKFGAQIKDLPNYFNGTIDDIRIYKRALTAAEVQTLFNQ
jgi:hypothetical protein